MPINKDAMMRYKILDKCFRNTGRNYKMTDLIAECNKKIKEINPDAKSISRRQIFYDIAFMESSEGWEIELDENTKEGRTRYYRYIDPKFSIDNMPLNEVEISHLRSAINTLSYFCGMPQLEWIQNISDTMDKIAISARSYNENNVVEFEHNDYVSDNNYFSKIYNAITNEIVLEITYKPFDSSEIKYTFHPYYLKQYNRCWYAFGLVPEQKDVMWCLALERIVTIKETNHAYIPLPKDWSWTDYFADIVGVTRYKEGKVEEVIIHAFGKTAKYIQARPIHESQRNKWLDNNTLEVRFKVIINYEFEKSLFSFADTICIIKPQKLVKWHIETLNKALQMYNLSSD